MEKQKIITIYKILGLELIKRGIRFLRTAFHLILKQTTRSNLQSILLAKNTPLKNVGFADGTYFYTDIGTMRDIIKYDWTDREKYVKEQGDCDDFAFRFKSHLQERFGITAIGLCKHIQLSDPDTGEHIGYHRANVFFADENDVLKLWFLEPQTDKVVEIKNYDTLIKLTGWLNKLNLFDF